VDTTNQAIPVSQITIIPLVQLDNTDLEILVIHVEQFLGIDTTLQLVPVIGPVIVDTTNQEILVSQITIIIRII